MKKRVKASITFNLKESHPDINCVVNPNEPLTIEDTYIFDKDRFDSKEQMTDYIKHDLSLVAGGGYSTEHIYNVSFNLA